MHRKKGYSGVAVFTKIKPDNVQYGTGHKLSDDEGRVIQLDFKDVRLINAYFPSGTSGDLRQTFKYEWLDEMNKYLNKLRKKQRNLFCVAIIILHILKLIFMIRKEIRSLLGFYPKKENG